MPDIYAAGDSTNYPIKQGGIASQRADAAAANRRARGRTDRPGGFGPVMRGVLRTERWARFLRGEAAAAATEAGHPLWWPPTESPACSAGCLQALDDEAGRPALTPWFAVKHPARRDVAAVEVLSLH